MAVDVPFHKVMDALGVTSSDMAEFAKEMESKLRKERA
jgi:hypothetical protein